jgi:predicted nucleotidyltransferase
MGLSGFSEGDYIKTIDDLYFAVKGGRHRDNIIIAVLRYIPDYNGERFHDGKHYTRVYDLESTTKFLKNNYPNYINYIDWLGLELQSVPINYVAEVYKPDKKLQKIMKKPLSSFEESLTNFIKRLSETSCVPSTSFGISGSFLIGLEKEGSDIDLNVYGESEGKKVYDALKILRESEDWISPYDKDSVESVLMSRWGNIGLDLNKMRKIECEKVLHGLVFEVDYFIRLLIEDEETTSKPICVATISATINNSTYSIFTPCIYQIKDASIVDIDSDYNIIELKSYRGKFTEQVSEGDKIIARGTIERVMRESETYYRLMLGQKGDYLISI